MSQAELASKLSVSSALVNRWVRGSKPCPQVRIDAIGDILGIAPAFLIGERPDPGTSPLQDARWTFRPAPNDGGRDYGNANIFATPPDIKTLIRETGQNSKDQGYYSHVHVRYALIELRRGTPEFNSFLEALKYSELNSHVSAAGDTDSRVGKKLKSALARLENRSKFHLLRVDDFGTTGLHGGERPGQGHNPFAALIRNNLDSSKSGNTAGGSYGLGKAVLWRCSGLSTVLFSSRIARGLGHNDENEDMLRFIAKAELTWHELDKKSHYAGPGWLGNDSRSIWCDAPRLSPLFLDRTDPPQTLSRSETSGTSALIVDFRDLQSDKELDPDEILAKLKDESALNFWPAIEAGNLSISVQYFVGKAHKRTEHVEPRETVARPFAEAYRAHVDGEVATYPEPGETASASVTLTIPATRNNALAVQPRQPEHDSNCTLLVRMAGDADLEDRDRLGSIAVFRGRGMVVRYRPMRNIVVGGRLFHAVLMAGETSEKSDAATAAEVFLRLSEPPAHDKWIFSEDIADNYKPGAKSRLHEMWKDVKTQIKKLIRPDDEGILDEPEELRRLLQIGSLGSPPTLTRLKHSSTFDGSSWTIDGEIKVLNRRSGIDAKIGIAVLPESGGRTTLGWASLEITKKIRGEATILPDLRTIRIEPKTSSISFRAVSLPGPASLRLERCIADVSYVAVKTPDITKE